MSEISPSVEKVASIDYILTKIFDCLPLKSIVRFEAVSKHWFSLITDPHFSPLLKPRHASGLYLLPSKLQAEPFSCEVHFLPLERKNPPNPPFQRLKSVCEFASMDVKILHSCNGLLLCSKPRAGGGDTDYFVYNPTTKQIAPLCRPSDGPYGSWRGIRGLSLAYVPLRSPNYKAICVWRFAGDLLYKILVYSSETHGWRLFESDEYFYYSSKAHFDRGVYWNGSVHWHSDTDCWLYFDVDQEKLNVMPPPRKLDDSLQERTFVYFGESNGHLNAVEDCNQAALLYVYEMERDYSGWFTKHKISLDAIASALPGPTGNGDITMISIIRGERDEDSFLALQVPGGHQTPFRRIVRYNLGYETLQVLVEFDIHRDACEADLSSWAWYDAFHYIESLASV